MGRPRTKEGSISRREGSHLTDWLNKIGSKGCLLDVAARRSSVISVRVDPVWRGDWKADCVVAGEEMGKGRQPVWTAPQETWVN